MLPLPGHECSVWCQCEETVWWYRPSDWLSRALERNIISSELITESSDDRVFDAGCHILAATLRLLCQDHGSFLEPIFHAVARKSFRTVLLSRLYTSSPDMDDDIDRSRLSWESLIYDAELLVPNEVRGALESAAEITGSTRAIIAEAMQALDRLKRIMESSFSLEGVDRRLVAYNPIHVYDLVRFERRDRSR